MTKGWQYGWFQAGTGKARWRRMTLVERYRLWKRRQEHYDLENVRGW